MAHVRYVGNGEFIEEMLFCKALETTMLLVHCVIQRQNLVSKNVSPVLNQTFNAVIKCVNTIKANAKCERFFK